MDSSVSPLVFISNATQHLQIDLKFPKIQSAQNSFYQTEQKSNHAIVGGILKDDISVHFYGNIQSVGRSYTRNTVYLLLLSDWKFRQESHNVLLAKSILTVEKIDGSELEHWASGYVLSPVLSETKLKS